MASPALASLPQRCERPERAEVEALPERLRFLDHVRVGAAVALVIFHSGLAYTVGDHWWYVRDEVRTPAFQPVLALLRPLALGLFFFAAGHVAPAALDRKGARRFLAARFHRLGWPLPVFLVLVGPVLMYAHYLWFRGHGSIGIGEYLWRIYIGVGARRPEGWAGPVWPDAQLGHLWFLQALLVYSLVYAGIRALWPTRIRTRGPAEPRAPSRLASALAIVGVGLAIGLACFLVRTTYPVYRWRAALGILQVHPADVPREAACFFLGVLAYRRRWLERLANVWGAGPALVGAAGAGAFLWASAAGASPFRAGGTDRAALAYALAESVVLICLGLGLVLLARRHADREAPRLAGLVRTSYGVYLFHLPIVVALNALLLGVSLGPLLEWSLTALLALPLSVWATRLTARWPRLASVVYDVRA